MENQGHIDFNFLSTTEELLSETIKVIMEEKSDVVKRIVGLDEERTFENTIQPLINVSTLQDPKGAFVEYVENFSTDKSLRDKASELSKEISSFEIELSQRKDLYQAINNYYLGGYVKERDSLTDEEKRFIEHVMRDYRRNGLHLPSEKSELIKQYQKELSNLETDFRKNIADVDTSFEHTREELDGMPETWFTDERLLRKGDTKEKDVFKVTLKYPDYIPGMKYLHSSALRKKLYVAYASRCIDSNIPIFEKAVKLRSMLSQLLGYSTYADYKTEVKIVKHSYNALNFESGLNKMFTPLYHKEIKELLEFALSQGFEGDQLEKWDQSYYSRMYEENVCDINLQEIRSYFPLDTVRDGMFSIYETLLGLNFAKLDNTNVWHDSVEYFKVTDKETDTTVGYFYLDMYPREGKYSHAAVFPGVYGCDATKIPDIEGDRILPIAVMACNFSKGECLTHDEVTTFFHEFGHVMHHICSKTQLADMASFHVEGDFVEAPSQMLEYWCFELEPLQIMSSHQDTGEKIPKELVDKLAKSKKVLQGYFNKRQILLGMIDLNYHVQQMNVDSEFDVIKMYNDLVRDILEREPVEGTCMVASFGHLMGGYEAGYYGYLRAESYAAAMFYTKFKDHLLDPVVGMEYRNKILGVSASKDSLDSLTDFLGEKPDDKYFLLDKGLSQEEIDSFKELNNEGSTLIAED